MSAKRRVSRSLPSQPFFQSKALRFIRTKLFSSVGRYLYHVYGRVFGTQGKRDRVSFRALHTYIHRLQTKALQAIKEGSGYRVVRLFRSYSAFSIVTSSALLVSVSNFTEGKDSESLLFGYINGASAENTQGVKHRLAAQVSKKENLSLVPLANVVSTIDPEQKDDTSLFDMQSGALGNQVMLSSQAGSSIARDPEEDGGVKIYTVATGDTVSGIAAKNGITVNTILWANDLDNVDQIKPGDQIFILPVAGLSYKVEPNDTLDSIAGKYKADREKIIAFNELPANGELTAGELIIIPDGRKEEAPKPATPDTGLERREYATSTGGTATDISGFRKLDGKAGTGHRFPYGYCTWFVAQKRYVPWSGNAGTWLYKAKAMGYKTGRAPAVGAIVVTTENRFYGHVALVEKVSGGNITVSEMNYTGWAKTSRRTLSATSKVIKGFIY